MCARTRRAVERGGARLVGALASSVVPQDLRRGRMRNIGHRRPYRARRGSRCSGRVGWARRSCRDAPRFRPQLERQQRLRRFRRLPTVSWASSPPVRSQVFDRHRRRENQNAQQEPQQPRAPHHPAHSVHHAVHHRCCRHCSFGCLLTPGCMSCIICIQPRPIIPPELRAKASTPEDAARRKPAIKSTYFTVRGMYRMDCDRYKTK